MAKYTQSVIFDTEEEKENFKKNEGKTHSAMISKKVLTPEEVKEIVEAE